MVNKNGTIMMLSRLLGIWLIVKSLFSLSLYYGSNIKDKKEIATDLIKLVLGILILTTPIVSIIFTGTVMGIICVIIGVYNFYDMYTNKSVYKVKIKK